VTAPWAFPLQVKNLPVQEYGKSFPDRDTCLGSRTGLAFQFPWEPRKLAKDPGFLVEMLADLKSSGR